jgi:hypothetical protein
MARISWSRTEMSGHALVGLVDLTFAGRTYRLATMPVQLDSATDVLSYDGTVDELVWSRSLDLFSLQPESEAIIVSGFIPADVAALVAEGQSIEGSAVQVSQVRVRPGADGAPVDAWEGRRVCLSGRVADAEYGATNDDGRTYVRFSAERNAYDSTVQIPPATHRVTERTWKLAGKLGDSDDGVWYPIPVGYPGRDDSTADGWITGGIGVWLSKNLLRNVLCVGVGKIEATTVRLNTDEDRVGVEANVTYTYTDGSTGSIVPARDKLGVLLAVVDYNQHGYGDSSDPAYLGDSFKPSVNSSDQVFVGYPAGSGGILWRGEVLRKAGAVTNWLMEQAGIPVDMAGFKAAEEQLGVFLIDTVINDACNPVEYATTNLLPLLPVSLLMTDNGVTPWVWNHRAGKHDAVAHLDCDSDGALDPSDTVKCDASNVINSWELDYSYSQRAEKYTHTARLGPKRVDTTAQAKSRLILTRGAADPVRVSIYARQPGPAGSGIRVICTVSGSAHSATDAPDGLSVIVNVQSGTAGVANIVATINADSAIIEAETTEEDNSFGFLATDTSSVALKLSDFGTSGNAACARSKQLFQAADLPGPNAGVRATRLESKLVYDHGTAAAILEWQAAAYALPHRRIEVMAPEEHYAWIDLGAHVLFTHGPLGFDEALGLVEAVDMYSDGTVGFRLLFIGLGT